MRGDRAGNERLEGSSERKCKNYRILAGSDVEKVERSFRKKRNCSRPAESAVSGERNVRGVVQLLCSREDAIGLIGEGGLLRYQAIAQCRVKPLSRPVGAETKLGATSTQRSSHTARSNLLR